MDPVLVTGTSGLVGYELAMQLTALGVDVLGLDLRAPPAEALFAYKIGDVADLPTVTRLMDGRPNVVHAGAVSGPMLMLDDPYGIAQANIGGAMSVFEAARQCSVRRLVWLSSIAVYGNQATLDPVPETAPPNPRSFYGHTKLAGEALLHGYVAHYGLSAAALRLSSVYGPRRQTLCALRMLIEAGRAGRVAKIAADGTSFRQYVHVKDAARAIVLALSAAQLPGFVYNLTGGTYVCEADLARMIQTFIPALTLAHDPPAWNEGHLGPLILDAAQRDFGYQPQISLHDGLEELCRHL
jgi:nucleoside-diphosphate-sugar epimerase